MDTAAISSFANEMVRTTAFRRLYDVSFLGIVDRYSTTSTEYHRAFSRAEHTVGVFELAMKIASQSDMSDGDAITLSAAALCHDLAHPAFSHSLEYAFDKRSQSMDHHAALNRLLRGQNSRSVEIQKLFSRHFIDIDRVLSVLSSNDALSFLFDNPINIDTIDGISRAIWSRGAMAPYNIAVLTAAVSSLYSGLSVSSELFFREADKFWNEKNGFYNIYLSGGRAAVEAQFQAEVRRSIGRLDYRFFEMTDSDFVRLFPSVLLNTSDEAVAPKGLHQSFEIDETVSVVDKISIYKRYKRTKSVHKST